MLIKRISDWARVQPRRPAMSYLGVTFTYADFVRSVHETELVLKRENLPVGKTALLVMRDLAEAWTTTLALRDLGLNTLCCSDAEMVADVDPKDVACVVTNARILAKDKSVATLFPGATRIVFPATRSVPMNNGPLPILGSDRIPFGGHILCTSGTTGKFKKILMEGKYEDERNISWSKALYITNATVHHNLNIPIFAWAGYGCPSCVWHEGGSIVMHPNRDFYKTMFTHGVNSVFTSPALASSIMRENDTIPGAPGSISFFVGAGALSSKLAQEIRSHPALKLTAIYGCTENHNYMRSPVENDEDTIWLRPHNETSYQVVDEDGQICSDGIEGEIRLKVTEIDPKFYLDDAAASEKSFRGGYYYPGDLAVRRADGRIRILGRTADVLNIKGFKLAVAPLEQQVQQMLKVETVCIFGGVNDEGIDEAIIAVEADVMPDRGEIDEVAKLFSRFERVRFERVSNFPRAEAGAQKIKRAELRKLLM